MDTEHYTNTVTFPRVPGAAKMFAVCSGERRLSVVGRGSGV